MWLNLCAQYEPVTHSYEHGSKSSSPIDYGKFLDHVSKQLLVSQKRLCSTGQGFVVIFFTFCCVQLTLRRHCRVFAWSQNIVHVKELRPDNIVRRLRKLGPKIIIKFHEKVYT